MSERRVRENLTHGARWRREETSTSRLRRAAWAPPADPTTGLGDVAGDGAAGAAELVVERYGGGECGEAGAETDAEVFEGAGAVAFEGEDVFAGLEDRLDALADRGEVWAAAAFVFAAGADDLRVERGEFGFEVFAAEVLVADQDHHLAGLALGARDHLHADEFLVDLGRGQRERAWGAVEREQGVQAEAPEEAAVAGAVAVVSGVRERVGEARDTATLDRLAGASALDRRRVDQQQIVEEPGALAREMRDQRLDLRREAQPALVERVTRWQHREQVREPFDGDRQEPGIRRDPHDRLRDTQRDDLRVGDPAPRVPSSFGQEIIRDAVNNREQQVEVGVHRDL